MPAPRCKPERSPPVSKGLVPLLRHQAGSAAVESGVTPGMEMVPPVFNEGITSTTGEKKSIGGIPPVLIGGVQNKRVTTVWI